MTDQPQKGTADNDQLKMAWEALGESASRSRLVVFTIVTASVLTFVAWYNSADSSWMDQRLNRISDALAWWPLTDASFTNSPEVVHCSSIAERHLLETRLRMARTYSERFFDLNDGDAATGILRSFSTNRIDQLKRLQDTCEKTHWDQGYVVHIAVFGISMDVNDLGLFSGIAFIILLSVLSVCLLREQQNLQSIFRMIAPSQSRIYYELMSMKQVFTLPRRPGQSGSGIRSFLINAYIILPAVMLILMTYREWATEDVGDLYSPGKSLFEVWVTTVSLAIVLFITTECLYRRSKMAAEWEIQCRKLESGTD